MTSKRQEARTILYWFYKDFSSIGGITQFRDTYGIPAKLFWLSLFLAGLAMTIWNITQIFQQYYLYDVITKTKLETVSTLEFPAITICNDNKIHCGHLKNRILECQSSSKTFWYHILAICNLLILPFKTFVESNCSHNSATLLCNIFINVQCKEVLERANIFHFGVSEDHLDVCTGLTRY